MPDDTESTANNQTETNQQNMQQQGDGASSAETQNTETPGPVPYERFKEVNDRLAEVRARSKQRDTEMTELRGQLTTLQKQLGDNEQAKTQVTQIQAQLDAAEQRASFYEEAMRPDIGCNNAKLAFMAAQSDGLIDDRGRVNWDALKQGYPELFRSNRQATPPGNAGAGTTTPPPKATSMDDLIRRRAGVGR